MPEAEWIEFLYASAPDLKRVGRIDQQLADAIAAQTTIVSISRPYIHKIILKHRLPLSALIKMKGILESGAVINDRERHLTFLFRSQAPATKNYKLVVKSDAAGSLIVVTTFHPVSSSEVRRRLKRGRLLKIQNKIS